MPFPLGISAQASAVRQIKDTQGLSYYLIQHIIISPVKTCAIKSTNTRDVGSSQAKSAIVTIERKQFVARPRQIDIEI